ncbi:hypothetical protein [Rhizobium sp. 1399]|jgi:hypothetical protein|uniref:hypothetical protein n=1 Tax=Rhizobium sp. 1399 TaxID=2817758 RepID=UPI0028649339|nr:hypothetical protein [Rhizobium sp. 1399]MDR6669027.1 hypothetical protein [Rhizobium sp. 1399]
MRLLKKLVVVTALPMLLCGCGAAKSLQAGAAKLSDDLGTALTAPYTKIDSQWRGKPIAKFEDKFGAPTDRSVAGGAPVLTWQRSRMVRIPARTYDQTEYIGNMVLTKRIFSPEHDQEVSCTVAVTAKSGIITRVKPLSDRVVPVGEDGFFPSNTSTCQIIFGL